VLAKVAQPVRMLRKIVCSPAIRRAAAAAATPRPGCSRDLVRLLSGDRQRTKSPISAAQRAGQILAPKPIICATTRTGKGKVEQVEPLALRWTASVRARAARLAPRDGGRLRRIDGAKACADRRLCLSVAVSVIHPHQVLEDWPAGAPGIAAGTGSDCGRTRTDPLAKDLGDFPGAERDPQP
jgi:hypothetical protein